MKQFPFLFLIILFLLQNKQSYQKKVIIDTDAALDDVAAIVYMTLQPQDEFDIQSILLTGTGEAYCKQGEMNMLRLLEFVQFKDIPVLCGQEHPTKGYFQFDQYIRNHANQNFFPFIDDKLALKRKSKLSIHATDLLIQQLQESNEQVDLVVLGPMTNIYLALEKVPSISDKISNIYFMGGAVDVPGNMRSSENKHAEYNVFCDSYACQQVFRVEKLKRKIKLLSLDGTNFLPVSKEFLDELQQKLEKDLHLSELKSVKNPVQYFIDLFHIQLKAFPSGGLYFWDVLAAVAAVDDKVCIYESRNLDVHVEEHREDVLTEQQKIQEELAHFFPESEKIGRKHLVELYNGNLKETSSFDNQIQVCKNIDRQLFDYEIYRGLLGQKLKSTQKRNEDL